MEELPGLNGAKVIWLVLGGLLGNLTMLMSNNVKNLNITGATKWVNLFQLSLPLKKLERDF